MCAGSQPAQQYVKTKSRSGDGGKGKSGGGGGGGGEEIVVLTRTIPTSDSLPTSTVATTNGGKPNRSLDALLKVRSFFFFPPPPPPRCSALVWFIVLSGKLFVSNCCEDQICNYWMLVEAHFVLCKSHLWLFDPGRSTALLFVGCLMSQQHASVSQGGICTDKLTCCHTEIEGADQTSTSPIHSIVTRADPAMPST